MSLVWRKIQRSNKKAAKYKFVCFLQELTINCGRKWQPEKVAVAWVHRRRRYVTKDHKWEPSITDPYRGIIVWPAEESECLEITTTLFRDPRQQTFDDKEWTFIVESVSSRGKRKPLAGISLNLRLFVNEIPGTQTELQLKLKPMCEHVDLVTMKLVLTCQMLQEGNALDEDMQSVASEMSVNQQRKADIADLTEFDNISPGGSSHGLSYSSPTSPDEPIHLPNEIASVASEIAEAWPKSPRLTDLPPRTSPIITPSPAPPVSISTRSSIGKHDESLSPKTMKTGEVSSKMEQSITAHLISRPDGIGDLPPTGADLLSWCQAVTKGYPGVNVTDFSKCWRNGLAFCALIHRFRPDLIGNFESLRPDDIRVNCKVAFDAAAALGVPKLIDPDEMVIMVVPDKIAVTSYVYNLRATLTGHNVVPATISGQRVSIASTSSWKEASRSAGIDDRASERDSTSPGIEERRKSVRDSKSPSNSTSRSEKSPSPIEQKPLMTRNQLLNPFDSDGEDGENVSSKSPAIDPSLTSPTVISSPTPIATPVSTPVGQTNGHTMQLQNVNRPSALMPVSSSSGDRQEDLKRRARQLLQQYQADDKSLGILSPEDERRRQELTEKARQLMQESQRKPQNVIRISDVLASVNEEVWPPRLNRPTPAVSNSAPTTRQTTPEHRQYIAQSLITKESLKQDIQTDSGAFDRFKRFGSMRTQELSQSINLLSSRFLYQKGRRSTSAPKELANRLSNGGEVDHGGTHAVQGTKDDSVERDTRSREQILAEIEQLGRRQRILDQKAADVEKRWRKAMQDSSGTELEQSLMNEYLSLLNERNMLTRRDMYLNILEKIRDHEKRFQDVQQRLAELMSLEDSEKTEMHKRQIDELIEKLIEIVNQRDELQQHLMAHEQGTQEAAELAENVFNHALPLESDDQKNCIIQ